MFSGDILAGFLSYITSNPPIYGMMYIPLNAVFVALIYQDSYDTDISFPTTMTQLFDTLTRGLIRRHLVSTRRVPSEYCMPPSLQRTEDISKLPPVVAQQLLQLAKVAYESLSKKRYVFTDLGEDFEHLGTMKKTTRVNVCTGPGCSYSFHHLTLQEYLTALHIAIVNPSNFKVIEWLEEGSVVVRFLAGMYRHDDYHSHPVYQELVQLLASERLQLVHCAYECPSIMDSVKVDYSKRDTIEVRPVVGFDWYATGYCISHFDERWGLRIGDDMGIEGIYLLVKGLESSNVAKKRIRYLFWLLKSFSFDQVFCPLRKFCELHHLIITTIHYNIIDHDDKVMLQQLITPGSGLRRLTLVGFLDVSILIPLLFQPSSLQELELGHCIRLTNLELIAHKNTNLKELKIPSNLLRLLTEMIINSSSLTYLEIVSSILIEVLPDLLYIVLSHPTLEVLQIQSNSDHPFTIVLQLIEAAGNSRLKKLRLHKSDYDKLPPHICIHEQYKHLLEPWGE